jgi:hypothetical protein
MHVDTVAGLLCATARFQAPAPPPETREARCGREETDGGGVCDMRAGHKGRCGTRISPQGHRRWFAASAPPSPAPSPDDEETNRE